MDQLSILLPLDGSKAAESALEYVRLLKPVVSSVRVLSVVGGFTRVRIEETRREEQTRAYLNAVAERLTSDLCCPVDCRVRSGNPTEQILREAREAGTDLIVMAKAGWTNAAAESLGGVADKVVRGSPCPTLLVSPRSAVPERINLITVPIDGSEFALRALPLARRFADGLTSKIRLVRALPDQPAVEFDDGDFAIKEIQEAAESTALRDLETAKGLLNTTAPVEVALLHGPVLSTLAHDLKASPPDLLIVTSHGAGGFIPWALGSVTDRLMRLQLPVLVVRPRPNQAYP
jgi:nucleotide-binding universal stress UspA family protein